MDPNQLRDLIIVPALQHLQEYNQAMLSDAAVNLLLCTAAHESLCGKYLKQTQGPALGIFMVQPETHKDIYINFASHRPILVGILGSMQKSGSPDDQLIYDLRYSAAIARLVYWRDPEPLPAPDDIEGMANTWLRVYNTEQGAGTEYKFLRDVDRVREALL